MKCIYFAWLIILWSSMIKAQVIIVVDQKSQQALEGVVLLDKANQTYVVTNEKGQADISPLLAAEEIEIRSLGYKTMLTNVTELLKLKNRIALEQSILNLEDIVISATRWRQSSGNVPSKIVTITPQEVALQNPQTAADLLAISGQVYVQKSQQGGGSPMIRGFATNRLIYTIDGIRMNTAIFRGGNLQNVINLDPFAVQNSEVFFGPGSVMYGSDAIGGVMSFQTLTAELSKGDKPLVTGKAIARYSSTNNEKTGHFDVNLGWKKWAMVSSFSTWDFDHLRQGSHGPDDYIKPIHVQRIDNIDRIITQDDPLLQIPSAYSQINMMHKLRFSPNEHWDIQYGFHFSQTTPYGRYDRHNRFSRGTLRYAEWDYGSQRWMMNNLSVNHRNESGIYDELSLRFAHQSFGESRIDRTLNEPIRTTQTEGVEAYSINLDMKKSFSPRNTYQYGFEYVMNDVRSDGLLTDISTGAKSLGPSRYPLATWSSLALFINQQYKLLEKLSLQNGVRLNYYSLNADFSNNKSFYPFPFSSASLGGPFFSLSIGAVYRPSDSWIIKTNLSTAFRAPNVDDIGKVFDSEPGALTVPNPDLAAEEAFNVDISLAKLFGEVAKIDFSAYYTELDNALVRRNFQLNGQNSVLYQGELSQVQAVQNAAVANVYGFQLGVELNLGGGVSFLSDLNYQVGEEELDDGTKSPSRHAAPLFGNSRLRYKKNALTIELNSFYQGGRSFEQLAQEERSKDEIYAKDVDGNNFAPAWYTLNLKAMYDLSKHWSISTGIENISDQRYRMYSSGISGSGRNFILSLTARI